MHFGKHLCTKGKEAKQTKLRGKNIAKQLKASNMSGCIQNTENITIKDTAYKIERETGEVFYRQMYWHKQQQENIVFRY